MSEPIKVDIWSDVACPWCFIGKRRFEAAAAEFDGELEVVYHSYELAPDTPEDYQGTHRDYLASRGFPPEQIGAMLDRVTGIAETLGLHYDYDANQPTRTLKAHELLHFAKAHGKQVEMKERLMQAYFERGEHVGRIDDLVRIAGEVGLEENAVRAALESGEFAAAVQEDISAARDIGVQGVPFFVFDMKYGVSGAQESATFLEVLENVKTERAASPTV
ncbi:MAG TPA: DsbA family oxidoreductase [Microbacteriaceae bacterium]|nr:DsbA family oxidoreductase [Microbacteriaceae bacterium]